jgi:undecaprenyl diphosphate synthase
LGLEPGHVTISGFPDDYLEDVEKKMSLKEKIDISQLPQHVAIIMDGNGRWAKERGEDRSCGHREGVISVRKVLEATTSIGLKYITMYTFSTENWNRPQEEVQALMSLLVSAIQKETPDLIANNVRLMAIGNLKRLPEGAYLALQDCIKQTSGNTGTTLVLALSYSSRWEIAEAARELAAKVEKKEMTPEDITEDMLSEYLTTKNIPDPDLLIRTGGEKRISNFLLWQASYAELFFSDTFWPDFREEELYDAILYYQQRERRFGKTSEQLI